MLNKISKSMILGAIGLSLLSGAFASDIDVSGCSEKWFIVSGYYSPIEGQDFYYRGTLEAERKLNGNGYHGASGKKVFNGMLAAPSTYYFGMKIYFPGYGVGEVADRGGAIVKKGVRGNSYDRIDVWMGEGEIGLKRALSFGKKQVKGYICDDSVKAGFDMSKFAVYKEFFDVSIWSMSMDQGRQDDWVELLQGYLNGLGYLSDENVTGYYGKETAKAICTYQVKKGITSEDSDDCGYFGPKTRASLKTEVTKKGLLNKNMKLISSTSDEATKSDETTKQVVQKSKSTDMDTVIKKIIDENTKDTKLSKTTKLESIPTPKQEIAKTQSLPDTFKFYRAYTKGEKNKEIRILQDYLGQLGYLSGSVNGIFDDDTQDAIYSFQLKYALVTNDSDDSVKGFFGPKTRSTLNDAIIKKLTQVNQNANEIAKIPTKQVADKKNIKDKDNS